MNGPQHFALAESHLVEAGHALPGTDEQSRLLAVAQIHATLALAAATALPPTGYPGSQRWRDWIDTVEGTVPVGVPA